LMTPHTPIDGSRAGQIRESFEAAAVSGLGTSGEMRNMDLQNV
jgi:hypothetical protein